MIADHDQTVGEEQVRPVPGDPAVREARQAGEDARAVGPRALEAPGLRPVVVLAGLVRPLVARAVRHDDEATGSSLRTVHVSSDAGRSYDLEVDGVRIHAVEWQPSAGVDGSGPVEKVLLVHGLGANTLSWEPACRPLADRLGATVTAIDLIGFGRTRVSERSASIAANARLVTAVLEQLGGAVVMGNSMGGTIGVHVAAAHAGARALVGAGRPGDARGPAVTGPLDARRGSSRSWSPSSAGR